jgi:Ca-activated chloride channel family protein
MIQPITRRFGNRLTVVRNRRAPSRLWVLVTMLLLLLVARDATVRADGFIIPVPPPRVPEVPDLAVRYHHVQVTITNGVARTEIDQVFVNESSYELEGTYIFPLPEEASVTDFAMFVDGERLSGKMLSRDEARATYEGIVNRRRDPALLEYVGRNAFQASVYPIPARGEKRIQLGYSQVLLAERGLVHYSYPLNTERFSSRPLEEVTIVVNVEARSPIRAIYSPSHEISVERKDPNSVLISFEASNVRPDKDFQLYYSQAEEEFGLNVLSYKETDDDGFFLLLVAPLWEVATQEVVAKDVFLVLDVSGSMEGQKLNQAKEAARFVLDHLNEQDRFGLIAFDGAVRTYADQLLPASERSAAESFIRRLSAGGGTNIQRALLEALAMTGEGRPQFVVFLTDGLPTVGVTDVNRIIDDVAHAATKDVRLFTLGVGYDVNTVLLDTISEEHRGASAYVEPQEDIEEEVSSFYAKISTPLLSDVRLEFGSIRVQDVSPDPIPDLFAGTQLLVAGRYRAGGTTTVTLSGSVNGRPITYTYSGISFGQSGGDDSIPRLWATRKIGQMLREIRLRGENKELVDSIVALSIRYGIMTPYTSFLVDEQQDILTEAGREEVAAKSFPAPRLLSPVGAQAVADSQAHSQLSEAERAASTEATQIRQVGNKTFVLRATVWKDTVFDPDSMSITDLQFGSSEYFRLLAERPEWGKYLAVGDRLIVVLDGIAYQVGPDPVNGEPPILSNPTPMPALLSPWDSFWRWFRHITGQR